MFHSTSHQMMRELDTGSAYRVQFKTSANHHTLSDMDELVQNHEQEQKAHDAVVQQAAARQKQLNAQLQMLYDTRPITRVTGGSTDDMVFLHQLEVKDHEERMQKALIRKNLLDVYGGHLTTAVQSEQEHKKAEEDHETARALTREFKAKAINAKQKHDENMATLQKHEVPSVSSRGNRTNPAGGK